MKIRGHWLRECGLNDEQRVVCAQTTDPELAEALDMGPLYKTEAGEFGGWDGDVYAYYEYFSYDEIQDTRFEEEVEPLPQDYW